MESASMKPSPANSVDELESQRAARLRNNKRRNRQRQKDYTSSLEGQLRDLQCQGVQATQEVQRSARKVAEDNARLRALLRHVGVAEHVIETWQFPENATGYEKKWTGASSREDPLDSAPFSTAPSRTMVPPTISHPEPSQTSIQNTCNREENIKNSDEPITKSPPLTIQLAPCKVLSRLAQDPGADVTQLDAEGANASDQENGGVECSKAHSMLMQFATTEEKLDVISQALERGCVKTAGGGCKVRNEAVWKAIDDVT